MPHNPSGKKKKKGRSPAHQNTFAFRHNPKSKVTDKILNSPIEGVCRRCREKLEWRKQYRKYKPRTQPGKCNICAKRNVLAAYHTICSACSRSEKGLLAMMASQSKSRTADTLDKADDSSDADSTENETESENKVVNETAEEQETRNSAHNPTTIKGSRVCAVCVKEPAEGETETDPAASVVPGDGGRMRLRERRAMERKLERLKVEEKLARKEARRAAEGDEVAEAEDDIDNNDDDHTDDSEVDNDVTVNDEDDPFLKAVGGADKLLTGEAFQRMRLQKESQQTTSPQQAEQKVT